ncbi:DUF3857 domain-containing protein [Acetobacteroides hydrogenigenes]|uniref:Uncharacterized protein DUF3857 n=1 Tax=Acetobacteroides hydrogenigenes TaxID=979970 RepID=A0A4R2EA88_9BACT|nr:DUF3857 domain-containing protein [Acetobacteroides hydrogenigenes]TCN63876.1 uncharacterized protein DUF3857 [Acetobacteroides hydrogenigenes]
MKKSIILGLLLTYLAFGSNAQNFPHEFGKYCQEEFDMKRYPKDPAAEAVVIYDIGKSRFLYDYRSFSLIFERRMKIKILNKAGLKWAQIAIPYYEENSAFEEIETIQGNTYNLENGALRRTPLDPKNAFTEKINEHWYERKFAMPDVKEGSIIEIAYTIKSPYLFNLRSWEFQWKIPVIYSEYTTRMTPFYNYIYVFQGAPKFDGFKSYADRSTTERFDGVDYNDMVYEFVMKDLPAFRDESFISSINDYIVKIDFQLASIATTAGAQKNIMTTWDKLVKDMLNEDSFGKYLRNSQDKAKTIVPEFNAGLMPQMETAKKINLFVKSNYSWNGRNDKFASKSIKEFFLSKTGNAADINLFLTGMLNAAGIESYPVLISTRGHGKIKLDYPFQHFFNSVVTLAYIDNQPILLDATDPLCDFGELPVRCINDKGLVVNKKKTEWATPSGASGSSTLHNITIIPMPDKDTTYQRHRIISTGYDAINYRSQFSSSYSDLKTKILGNFTSSDSLRQKNLLQIGKPFELSYNVGMTLDQIEDKIIVTPFLNASITENPLKQDSRSYPVDMVYSNTNQFSSTIIIPKGYKLLSKPEDVTVDNPMVNIAYKVEQQGDASLRVSGRYTFKKDSYPIYEYSDIKFYYKMIVDKFNQKIILQKI